MRIQELRAARADRLASMDRILNTDLTEANPIMTAEQEERFNTLESEAGNLAETIKKMERVSNLQGALKAPTDVATRPDNAQDSLQSPDPDSGFECFAEFMFCAVMNEADPRLARYKKAPAVKNYKNEQSMATGSKGGFAVPNQWSGELLRVEPQEAIVESRARSIPAGSPPDASITFPALNQKTGSNMYGGVSVSWTGEGGAKPETDADLEEITLEPQELAAHIVTSDKLLRNWGAASVILAELLRAAMLAERDIRFLRGDGVAKPRGIIGHAGTVAYNRAGAGLIDYPDIVGMLAVHFLRGGRGVWTANQGTMPELFTLTDAAGNSIFIPSIVDSEPDRLMGRPILWNERSPALGTNGDLLLADYKKYMIKQGSGPFVGSSEHVHFVNNKTVIKAFQNVDGQPQLTGLIASEDGVGRSPFVSLDVP